ncbi:PHA/PHB synthase family protein [Sphingomonas solaris]|uniref:Class I poly(R)-hydroxyalkanoic acid synthase n=1 Tax=Alterirhizorhabdus solaris TaxID=2529389 RepID=A0A558R555_9SPHN|nr:alpha/beta fold hydrolase [Sphingomonas solaris]TVV74514.1 class I poly(R)-hydroxyalkanoic acid synthase [Sphingomonas solaris]
MTVDLQTPGNASAHMAGALARAGTALMTVASSPRAKKTTRSYDPAVMMNSLLKLTASIDPADLFSAQVKATQEWAGFWVDLWTPQQATDAKDKPRGDRRFADPRWEQPYFRAARDAYLLASRQLRDLVSSAKIEDTSSQAMAGFLLDQYLNAISPTNFVMTNPEVVQRTRETAGANLVNGFAHVLEDFAAGKGIVKRRAAADVFEKGKTIAATPGSVVFQNKLFQLIQYAPTTPDVSLEPLLYVPPLVNRYYMIDLQPKSSLVRWLVEQGRTVFVISWVNPDDSLRDCALEDYVLTGVVEAIGAVRRATDGAKVDLFSFCLGGTLGAMALAWLEAKGRANEVNSATLIGTMLDFSNLGEWAAFVHEAHMDALDDHIGGKGYIDANELQQLFSAVRANDLIWSSVVDHYLLDRPAPPSDLLTWFEDGARIPAAFMKSYNRSLLHANGLTAPGGFTIGDVAIDLAAMRTPAMVIALKADHVSAWNAVYDSSKLLGGPVTFILGGSGHNAGVINPPAANKHGYWTNPDLAGTADTWLESAEKHPGSWWPEWVRWLDRNGSGKRVAARQPGEGGLSVIEAAPGTYATTSY